MRLILIPALLLGVPFGAAAQTAPATCAATPAALPAELAGWTTRHAVDAAGAAAAAPELAPGTGVEVGLLSLAEVRFAAAPGKAGPTGSYGGLLGLTVKQAGSYRIALGEAAWVDVVKGGTSLVSTGHGHGPACSTIRKLVAFELTPGRYIVQIAGSTTPRIAAMVVPPS